MQDVVKANAGRMFLSLSIAPLFPSGYGHARRLSCDTKGHISGKDQSTEYMLNALTIISGGMILDSTRLADDPDGQAMALQVYNNRA